MKNGKIFLVACLASCLVLTGNSALGETEATPPSPADMLMEPEAVTFTSEHEIQVDGKRIAYTAKAGTLLMHDEAGKAIAEFGYTSYTRKDSDPARRPIMFAWNGGPGSASMWLHMGVLGPQITVVEDLKVNGKGPFKRSDNPHSIIDKVDLVMVDPVGTGYSRAVGEAEDEDFWGVDNDIKSVSDFIAQFITMNNRWASPKYILGESYGGMRAGGVSLDLLTRHNIALNGVVLVSPYMDVAGGGVGPQSGPDAEHPENKNQHQAECKPA